MSTFSYRTIEKVDYFSLADTGQGLEICINNVVIPGLLVYIYDNLIEDANNKQLGIAYCGKEGRLRRLRELQNRRKMED